MCAWSLLSFDMHCASAISTLFEHCINMEINCMAPCEVTVNRLMVYFCVIVVTLFGDYHMSIVISNHNVVSDRV